MPENYERDWAQRLADLMNEAEGQGFPTIGISPHAGEICVSSYGGGVHYADATVKKIEGRWVVPEEDDE